MSLARCAACPDRKREVTEDEREQDDREVLPIGCYGTFHCSRGRLWAIAGAGAGDERDDGHRGTGTAATIADCDGCARQHLRSADAWESHSRRGGARARAAGHADDDSGNAAALTAVRTASFRSEAAPGDPDHDGQEADTEDQQKTPDDRTARIRWYQRPSSSSNSMPPVVHDACHRWQAGSARARRWDGGAGLAGHRIVYSTKTPAR